MGFPIEKASSEAFPDRALQRHAAVTYAEQEEATGGTWHKQQLVRDLAFSCLCVRIVLQYFYSPTALHEAQLDLADDLPAATEPTAAPTTIPKTTPLPFAQLQPNTADRRHKPDQNDALLLPRKYLLGTALLSLLHNTTFNTIPLVLLKQPAPSR